jgi:hypothetical protein
MSSARYRSQQTNSPALIANNSKSATFGDPLTTMASPYGEVGSSLAQSLPLQSDVAMRHEWDVASCHGSPRLG